MYNIQLDKNAKISKKMVDLFSFKNAFKLLLNTSAMLHIYISKMFTIKDLK